MKNRFENLEEALAAAQYQSKGEEYRVVIKSWSKELGKFAYYVDENSFIQLNETLIAQFENGKRI